MYSKRQQLLDFHLKVKLYMSISSQSSAFLILVNVSLASGIKIHNWNNYTQTTAGFQ